MKGKLTITKLAIADGYIHSSTSFNDKKYAGLYQGSKTIAKCFHIEGILDGRKVRFVSPTVQFSQGSGLVHYIIMHDKTGWFDVVKGESTFHKGHEMFDGGSTPNWAIDCHDKIIALVKVGDEINISYSIKHKGTTLPIDILWRVKIIK